MTFYYSPLTTNHPILMFQMCHLSQVNEPYEQPDVGVLVTLRSMNSLMLWSISHLEVHEQPDVGVLLTWRSIVFILDCLNCQVMKMQKH